MTTTALTVAAIRRMLQDRPDETYITTSLSKQVAAVLGTLIADLKAYGLLQ